MINQSSNNIITRVFLLKYMLKLHISYTDYIMFITYSLLFKGVLKCLGKITCNVHFNDEF